MGVEISMYGAPVKVPNLKSGLIILESMKPDHEASVRIIRMGHYQIFLAIMVTIFSIEHTTIGEINFIRASCKSPKIRVRLI